MKDMRGERIKDKLISLIESEFESDAAFERALGLPQKTVNNWRRDRSRSYMNMLPKLSEVFSVSVSELMDIPLKNGFELSDDEIHLLSLYRSARALPKTLRDALRKNLESTVNLYVDAYKEQESAIKEPKKRKR